VNFAVYAFRHTTGADEQFAATSNPKKSGFIPVLIGSYNIDAATPGDLPNHETINQRYVR
jgi:hypothetical protein